MIVHASSLAESERAVRGLRSVGFLELAGFLLDPVADATATLRADRAARAGAPARRRRGRAGRRPGGRRAGRADRCPAATTCPTAQADEAGTRLPPARPLVTVCESGARAAVAASVLAAHGLDVRPLVHGGVQDLAARLPTAQVSRSTS